MALVGCDSETTGTDPGCEAATIDSPPDVAPRPLFDPPAPDGPYRVGTRILHFVDPTRDAFETPAPGDHREVVVQLYYPTEARGPMAPVMSPAEAVRYFYGYWPEAAVELGTHSSFHGSISDDAPSYPLVLYSHQYGTGRHDNRSMLESLASQGMVVAAVSHTWYDGGTTLANGQVTDARLAEVLTNRDSRHDIFVTDLHFVLAQLAALNASESCDLLAGRLDLDHVGMVGWGEGGAAALHACADEPSCKAVASLDWAWSPSASAQHVPALYVAGLWQGSKNALWSYPAWDRIAAGSTGPTYSVVIDGVGRYDFSSFLTVGEPAISEKAGPCPVCGPIDERFAYEIYDAYVEALFLRELLGRPAPLLDAPSGLAPGRPEVYFERSDAGAPDLAPLVLGTARDAETGIALPELTVTSTAGTVVPPGAYGRFLVTDGSTSAPLTLAFSAYIYWSMITTVVPGARAAMLRIPMLLHGSEDTLLAGTSITAQSGMGHVLVELANFDSEAIGGVEVTSPAGTVHYTRNGVGQPALTSSVAGISTLAFLPNAAPGTVTLTFAHPTFHCAPAYGPSTAPDTAEVLVQADTITYVQVVCGL